MILKLDALKRCFEDGRNVTAVVLDMGYLPSIINCWRRRLKQEGIIGLRRPKKSIPWRKFIKESIVAPPPLSSDEIKQRMEHIRDMQMDIDILKETIPVLKNDHSTDR